MNMKVKPQRHLFGIAIWIVTPALLTMLLATTILNGCNKATLIPAPYILPNYYNAIEVPPTDLCWTYYGNYADRWQADKDYTGKTFIFKNIPIVAEMLINKDKGFMWVSQVRCKELQTGSIAKLKAGDVVDVIGVNRGVPNNEYWVLDFTECVFIPAGSLGVPIAGGATFKPGY